jgi:hypothetical protein
MKKILISVFLLVIILSCSVSKKTQLTNSYKYEGIIFYTKTSPFLEFYPTEKKLDNKQMVYILDNTYGNRVWFSKTKYQFALEDILMHFDSIIIAFNERTSVDRYAYVTANFNQSLKTVLRDSMYRTKPYKYLDLSFDIFTLDNRDIRIDSLIFNRNKLNRQYRRLVKLHEGSIKTTHSPPLPQ